MTERRVKAARVVAVLTEAKAVIQNPSNWIKHRMCNRDDYEESDRFCSLGAIRKVSKCYWGYAQCAIMEVVPKPKGAVSDPYYVAMFNDEPSTTHDDVMALFDLAIEEQCKIVREEAAKDDSNLSDQG